jgi:hypothetical protein
MIYRSLVGEWYGFIETKIPAGLVADSMVFIRYRSIHR